MDTTDLLNFIVARHRIWEARNRGESWPWTEDPILQQYRFCNVYRNLDKETQLIHRNWLDTHSGDKDLWFAMVVARLINWWPTLAELRYPDPFLVKPFVKVMDARRARGDKVFTGAYMVRADAVVGGTKAAYLAEHVLLPLWLNREVVRPKFGDSLDSFHKRLLMYRDMGSFMAAQVVADIKYDHNGPLHFASDWATWAASGPGSRRGLARVLGRKLNYPWKESEWRVNFSDLLTEITPILTASGLPTVTGQDLQNCLCEFDKYERVRLGEGTPRSKYQPPVT